MPRRWWDIKSGQLQLTEEQIGHETEVYRARFHAYERFGQEIERLLIRLVEMADIKIATTSSRPKAISEFARKCRRKRYTKPFEQMSDLAGVRIVLYFVNDAEQVETIIRDSFDVDEIASEDKHRTKKVDEFGYLSNHLVVRIKSDRASMPEWKDYVGFQAEIQVRTLLEHSWAEVSHRLNYKKEQPLPEDSVRDLARMMALLETVDKTFVALRGAADEFLLEHGESVGNRDERGTE